MCRLGIFLFLAGITLALVVFTGFAVYDWQVSHLLSHEDVQKMATGTTALVIFTTFWRLGVC